MNHSLAGLLHVPNGMATNSDKRYFVRNASLLQSFGSSPGPLTSVQRFLTGFHRCNKIQVLCLLKIQ